MSTRTPSGRVAGAGLWHNVAVICTGRRLPALAALLGAAVAVPLAAPSCLEGATLQELAVELASATTRTERILAHQLRSVDAMADLVRQLPEEARPTRIVYVASGAHLAPLVLCQDLPAGLPCQLVLTDTDPSVSDRIDAALEALRQRGVVDRLERGGEGPARWRFLLAGHPVGLALTVPRSPPGSGQPPLFTRDLLAGADLVVSHDWSGDPLGNLRLIRDFLEAARQLDGSAPPLMIEDLERHPFPIDMAFFGPVARTSLPYGHRTADEGLGRHGEVELGQPLFAGAVVLGFTPRWWRACDRATVDGVLDFLLFNEFSDLRQNVLEGGAEPLLSPALLDWWTGFGERSVATDDPRACLSARQAMIAALTAAAPHLTPDLRRRAGCRLRLWKALLETRVAGGDVSALLPAAGAARTARPGSFPSPAMERLYGEALANVQQYQLALSADRDVARSLLDAASVPILEVLTAACPVPRPEPQTGEPPARTSEYRSLAAALADLP